MEAIWAQDLNGGIGVNNKLLLTNRKDMAFFREQTLGRTILMGSNTWRSLPTKPLKQRLNVVLTRGESDLVVKPHLTVGSPSEARTLYPDAIVIGGAELYRTFLDDFSKIFITFYNAVAPEADSFAPPLQKIRESFVNTSRNETVSDEGLVLVFTEWVRRT